MAVRFSGALDIFVGQADRLSRVQNDPDGCHVADIAMRGARRDQ